MSEEAQTELEIIKPVPLPAIFLVFLKIGAFTFGGGYAILPVIQREVVAARKWVDSSTFFDILIITQSMPGQLALNSAIQVGIRLRGIKGGIVAALGVIVPSVSIILFIAAFLYAGYQDTAYVRAVFYGIRPAVVALIAAAALHLGKGLIQGWISIALGAVLLAVAVLFKIHPIAILMVGGLAGLIFFRKEEI